MTIKQHIRMTASEIAMGRYMRAPDHDAMTAEFDAAFSAEALKDVAEDKTGGGNGAVAAADSGGAGAAAAAADSGDGAGAASGDGAGAAASADGDQGAGDGAAAAAAADGGAGEAGAKEGVDGAATGEGEGDGSAAGGDAGAAAAAADGGAAGKDGAGAAAVPGGPDADAILDRLAEAVANKQPKVETPAEVAVEAPPLFDDAEKAQLAKFREDWPEEAKAVDLMQRELGRGVIQYVFDQIAPEVRTLRELVQTLALRAHHSDLDATIGEYPNDDEIESIKSWVKTQPSYLQTGMNGVIDGGTAEEIGDLVSRYREATGKQSAGAQAGDPKPAVEAELSDEAKKAALALAPVGSKRSAVQSPEDASDFDAGWVKYKDVEV